tara:strand:+ start:68 stop:565 length:498 start_codon:yes stop_codon:yes gene_type:complete
MDLIQLEQKDLKEFKRRLHESQGYICPILKMYFPVEQMAVDHKHKRKDDPIGIEGNGLVRGVIMKDANRFEGKVLSYFVRYGLAKYVDLPTYLRNLADYIEEPPCEQIYIHPKEKKKEKLGKRIFNKINKEYKKRNPLKKELEYPASKKPTKKIKELATEYKIEL